MSEPKYMPGPWQVTVDCGANVIRAAEKEFRDGGITYMFSDYVASTWGGVNEANARLIAAAPELLEVLHECIDAQWVIDSHAVEFDGTVHFGPYYDFSGLDGIDRHEFLAEHSCVVWPSGGKWSAYCTYEGSTWFESFDGADAAKETCMKLLDKVMPTHPAMKARAAIAKANGGE